MSASDEQIGKRLNALRGDMSQAALAAAMADRGHKWSQATVWSVETGKRPLRLAEAQDVSAALDVSVTELLRKDRVEEAARAARSEIGGLLDALDMLEIAAHRAAIHRYHASNSVNALRSAVREDGGGAPASANLAKVEREFEDAANRSLVEIVIEAEAIAPAPQIEGTPRGVDQ